MTDHPPPAHGPRKLTLIGALTVAGDIIVISLALLVLWLGIVTAGPGSAAALEARRRVDTSAPSAPLRLMLRETGRRFRELWAAGPICILIGSFAWVGTAFWLTVPPPIGVIMMAVVLCVAAVVALVTLAVPTAALRTNGFRPILVDAARVVSARPFVSIVALAAAAAAVVVAAWLPTVGLVGIGAAMVEISWRAWAKRALLAE